MSRHSAVALLSCLFAIGCGSAQSDAEFSGEPTMITETRVHKDYVSNPSTTAPEEGLAEEGVVKRSELQSLLANGPAHILAQVALTPVKKGGKFVGYRIDAFHAQLPRFIDLRLGDVVTEVNGRFINKPDVFFEVFEELKVASEIRFVYLREGQTRQVSYPVTD